MENNQEGQNKEEQIPSTLEQVAAFQKGELNTLPVGNNQTDTNDGGSVEMSKDETNVKEDVKESKKEPAVVLDGKEFASEKEAYEYAQQKLREAEQEKLILEAQKQAYEEAMQNLPLNQQQELRQQEQELLSSDNEDDLNRFYEDPKAYLAEQQKKIYQQVKEEIYKELNAEKEEEKLWNEFFRMNPDLEGFKDDCNLVLQKNWDTIQMIAKRDKRQAMQYLADKTREKFRSYIEKTMPRKTLSNQVPQTPDSVHEVQSNVTKPQSDEEPLDFASQIRSIRRGRRVF